VAFYCQECGYKSAKWLGRCPECGAWNSFVEEAENRKKNRALRRDIPTKEKKVNIFKLSQVSYEKKKRIKTGISELDLVLGGGIVPGSLILIGGDPGIGKSTLLTQIASILTEKDVPVLYASGEESSEQVKMRAERLGLNTEFFFLSETDLEVILSGAFQVEPRVLIVDSIQTVYLPEIQGSPGGVSQIRECTNALMRFAKEKGVAVILVGHITKGGIIAGPKVLEHLVDVVLYMEGERETGFRILRAVKNRFGALNEIGVFVMTEKGLVPHSHYEDVFISGEGGAIFCILEGTRPILVEVQALVTQSYLSFPRRTAVGFDPVRLSLLIAILEKRLNFRFGNQDIYLKVSGGLRIIDPAADLGVCMALVANLLEKKLPEKTVFIGEVGLSGELRLVRDVSLRLREAEKKGFKTAFVPAGIKFKTKFNLNVFPCKSLSEVCKKVFG